LDTIAEPALSDPDIETAQTGLSRTAPAVRPNDRRIAFESHLYFTVVSCRKDAILAISRGTSETPALFVPSAQRLDMPVLLKGQMKWQFFHYNGLVIDLNCGWYCLKAALKIKYPNQTELHHSPHPGLGRIAFSPDQTGQAREIQIPANNCLKWVGHLINWGPIIVGVRRHFILINGADETLDLPGGRLYFYDPLTGVIQRDDKFEKLYPAIWGAYIV
jgi:hypothetical protein